MDKINQFFQSAGIQFDSFWKSAVILLIGSVLFGLLGKFVFGNRSTLNTASSSSIGIIFIYVLSVILTCAGPQFEKYIAPLPFIEIKEDSVILFDFTAAHYTAICYEIFSMITLAFLVNIADSWLPRGKSIFTWIFFRCLTVAIGYAMHLVLAYLFNTSLPEDIVLYTPVILLGLLILMLLTGALKVVIGALLSTVNPIIGGLYTFFFATIIGKQITKSVLTTAILCAIIIGLRYAGLAAIAISTAALSLYIPLMILLVIVWFLVGKFL